MRGYGGPRAVKGSGPRHVGRESCARPLRGQSRAVVLAEAPQEIIREGVFAIENLPRGERSKIALPPAEEEILGEGIFAVTHYWRSLQWWLKQPRVEKMEWWLKQPRVH